jgi:cytosine/adenosine deaminase-related metal-dependent hydrolase
VSALVIEGCAVATADGAGTEYADGHVVADGGVITAVGAGPASEVPGARHVDGRGCLATPGLVNTHHHLYQWATQGLAQDAELFDWLTALYPVWARLDADAAHDAALSGLAWLAASGTTTVADHAYLFPPGAGDLVAAEVSAARRVGVRLHLCRGSMDLGASAGGLPPDDLVEDTEAALAATEQAIAAHHDPAPDAYVRVAVAPCSPFSASEPLMRGSADLARATGTRLHTHFAEGRTEEAYCRELTGTTLVGYLERLGWLGPDVWLAHAVHQDAATVKRLAATGTGVAHCPTSNARLASGIAPVRDLLDAGAPVGLGVDGSASAEATTVRAEAHQAVLAARTRAAIGGDRAAAAALTVREALALATIGGARCLGRDAELGSLEPGKLADVALWRVDGPGHAQIPDPVAALVLPPVAPPLELLLVGGRPVADHGVTTGVTPDEAVRAGARAARTMREDR